MSEKRDNLEALEEARSALKTTNWEELDEKVLGIHIKEVENLRVARVRSHERGLTHKLY